MLKYKELVCKLSEAQKILILSDISSLSRREFKRLGLPELKKGYVDEYALNVYPRSSILANSWDMELISAVAKDTMSSMYKDGVELAIIPSPKAKINPYRSALSEDPLLSSDISGEYVKSAKTEGVAMCLDGYSLENDELEWMDAEPDERVINEYITKPYFDALSHSEFGALMSGGNNVTGKYKAKNTELIENVATNKKMFLICEEASPDYTVHMISKGIICLRSSGLSIERALRRYEELNKSVEKGELGNSELCEEILSGNAIASETVDVAVDRVFDFINSCRNLQGNAIIGGAVKEKLAARAVRESAVLLKNENKFLPLTKKEKIFIIGDIRNDKGECIAERCADILTLKGYGCIGWSQGYEISKDRSDMSLGEAYNLSENADKIILLLGRNSEREMNVAKTRNLELPANQVALAKKLMERGKNVVAVVSTGYGFDIDAVEGFESVMLMDLSTASSTEALADIVTGAFSPSGKLASSLYRRADDSLKKQKYYRSKGSRSGIFVGYRYYDTAKCNLGFPFGHGIGFSEFSYSKPRILGNTVTFTLKNTGKYDAAETVQMYAGLSLSSVIRPKKELIGYKKITLKAGESKQVEMKIDVPSVYDKEGGAFVKESGIYTVYVGSSVDDVRFFLKYSSGDAVIKSDGADLIDYLQSESNVVRDKYTLEANYELMKRTVRNIISGVILLVLAVFLRVYCHSNAIESEFLNVFSVALTLVSAGFFIMEIVDRMKIANEERIAMEKANKEHFDDAEVLNVFSTDRMFKEEFEADEDDLESVVPEVDATSEEYVRYVDGKFDYFTATKEFILFASERGCKLDANTAREILASVSSSRMMIVNGMSEDDFELLMKVMCEYFGTELHTDKLDSTYTDDESVLFEAGNEHKKRSAMLAIEAAFSERHKIHLVGFSEVKACDFAGCLSSFVRYAKSPNGYNSITVGNGNNQNTYYVPKNLWIVLNLSPDESISNLSEMAAEVSAFNVIRMARCEESEVATDVHKFYYYQLDYLADKASSKCEVDECEWKKLDAFVEFINKDTTFSIGNKQWVGIEKYIAVYEACGGELNVAIDSSMAVRLIPSALVAVKQSEKRIDLLEGINIAFGEGEISACRSVIRDASQNRAKAQN